MKNKNNGDVDYLDEDPIISDQNWVCISFLSTKNIKNMDKNEKYEIKGIKIRGVYSDYEEATKRAEFLRNLDPNFDIFIGEVGKWLPCDVDIDKAKDRHYAEKELNDIMKTYKEDLKCVKEMEGERKKDMLKNAKVDKDNTKKVEELRKKLEIKKKELNMDSKNNIQDENNNENNISTCKVSDKLAEIISEFKSDKTFDIENKIKDSLEKIDLEKIDEDKLSKIISKFKSDSNTINIEKNINMSLNKLKELCGDLCEKLEEKNENIKDIEENMGNYTNHEEVLKESIMQAQYSPSTEEKTNDIEEKLMKLKKLYEKTQE